MYISVIPKTTDRVELNLILIQSVVKIEPLIEKLFYRKRALIS